MQFGSFSTTEHDSKTRRGFLDRCSLNKYILHHQHLHGPEPEGADSLKTPTNIMVSPWFAFGEGGDATYQLNKGKCLV